MAEFFEIPKGFSQLARQNQASVIQLIDVLLDFQSKGWHGSVELELAPGSMITQIKPKPAMPTIKVQSAK